MISLEPEFRDASFVLKVRYHRPGYSADASDLLIARIDTGSPFTTIPSAALKQITSRTGIPLSQIGEKSQGKVWLADGRECGCEIYEVEIELEDHRGRQWRSSLEAGHLLTGVRKFIVKDRSSARVEKPLIGMDILQYCENFRFGWVRKHPRKPQRYIRLEMPQVPAYI